ncbi:OadG family protein [Wukongibacter sp. M2B1]|uniref:OadG family protein n=1 Tax=Wukongibacter sp. M2B1 TaxID=3088895 RepID=UPI003D78E08A
MENLSLLERFSNPELIKSMSLGEKLLASGTVAILGMAITFVVLMILWGLIIMMTKFVASQKKEAVQVAKAPAPAPKPAPIEAEEDNEELVAVITAAIAASLNTSTHNIVVRNIVRVADSTPAWGRAGRIDQMNNML